jgi:hypothetical protein
MFETVMNVVAGFVLLLCFFIGVGVPINWFIDKLCGDPLEDLEKSLNMEIEDGIKNSDKTQPLRD